jgi:hypothetical protein
VLSTLQGETIRCSAQHVGATPTAQLHVSHSILVDDVWNGRICGKVTLSNNEKQTGMRALVLASEIDTLALTLPQCKGHDDRHTRLGAVQAISPGS